MHFMGEPRSQWCMEEGVVLTLEIGLELDTSVSLPAINLEGGAKETKAQSQISAPSTGKTQKLPL